MDRSQVIAKLQKLAKRKINETLERAAYWFGQAQKSRGVQRDDNMERVDRHIIASTKINARTASSLVYCKRDNLFSNSKGTCVFNPETKKSYSYSWYELSKEIKGIVLLNTYNYSRSTIGHIGDVATILRDLGIKYKTVESPGGLRDLENAVYHELDFQSKLKVEEKYARIKGGRWHRRSIRESNRRLETLASVGFFVPKGAAEKSLERAEAARAHKLAIARERAAHKRARAKIQIVQDFENKLPTAIGLHVTLDVKRGYWNEDTKDLNHYGLRHLENYKSDAVAKGFQTIIVHTIEPQHLRVIKRLNETKTA